MSTEKRRSIVAPFYMTVVGVNQGKIEGDTDFGGDRGKAAVCYYFNHVVDVPTDPRTNLVSGHRDHSPVSIIKHVDKTSNKLAEAQRNNETTEVNFDFYKRVGGEDVRFYTITLTGAKIVKLRQYRESDVNGESSGDLMEEVRFSYDRIVKNYPNGNVQYTDVWDERHNNLV